MRLSRPTDQLVDLVRDLLALPAETVWVEDKVDNDDPAMIGERISALANSAALVGRPRGYLLWGVRDGDRIPVGTRFMPLEKKVGNEDLQNWLLHLLTPQIFFEFHEITLDEIRLVVLEIDRAATQPVRFRGVEYIRVGSHTKKLHAHPDHERRLWRVFEQAPFETCSAVEQVTSSAVLSLLDYPSYFDLTETPLPENRSGILEALAADQLITPLQSDSWTITNLGAALFARHLDQFPTLRRKAVRVIQYCGSSRLETIKEQVGKHGYANGFAGMIEYTSSLVPSNEVLGQALRRTVRMYPDLALRELLANALIHQDFGITGTGPTIEIFDDRIEITNPGKPLVSPDRFIDSPPRSRNEQIASLMRRVGICEERGSGWDKICFQIEIHQLPAPLIEVTEDHTRVTLFSHRDLNAMDRTDRVRAVYLHACLRYVSRQKVTNTTVRERFGIDAHNSAKASRLIKEAVDDGTVVARDPSAAKKLMEYVPWWAAPDPDYSPTGI